MVDIIYNFISIVDNMDDKRCLIMKLFRNLDFKNEPILAFINLILYIFLIIVIYQIILKISGNSPTFETIIITALSLIMINSFRYEYLLGKYIGENTEFKKNIKQSFELIRKDIQEIKRR